jgi:simple sugar transport system ATP-binding protein
MAVDGVSLEVRAGEILGIAGVQGNGQTELAEALTGLRKVESGQVQLLSEDTTHSTPRQIVEAGVAHVPEDRHKHGLVLSFPVRDNIVLCTYYRSPFADGIELDYPQIVDQAERLVKMFDVRTPGIGTSAGSLSGGNQQKVIVARELSRPIKLLIANQPTRGLDVGSIEFIHGRIVKARDAGAAVLLVSAELDEIMSLSDRIAVMYKGHILATLDAETATREQLGLLMAGVTSSEAAEQVAEVPREGIDPRQGKEEGAHV